MQRKSVSLVTSVLLLTALTFAFGAARLMIARMGRQADGSYLVSSGQRIEGDGIVFNGRPSDIALHPDENVFAVLNQKEVFISTPTGMVARSRSPLGDASAGFHGLLWTYDRRGSDWWPNAMRFVASTDQGYLMLFNYSDLQLEQQGRISLVPEGSKQNARPGGMCLTRDHKTLFVAAAGLDAVVEVDMASLKRVREFKAQTLPYEVKLSSDEKTLIVSNWGGRKPLPGDATAKSDDEDIVINGQGSAATGTVSLIDRQTGETANVEVGIHPTAMAVSGSSVYVANAMSDSISKIDVASRKVAGTFPVQWRDRKVVGAMPNALAIRGDTLYICNGGDNALAEMDIKTGKVRGFRHTGYFPCAMELSRDGRYAYVLNSKGNGSVENTRVGNPGSPHDFQGTVTVVDLKKDLAAETEIVARDNRWNERFERPKLAVYNGAIKHVLYIIKENQTYDSIYGDMEIGNGDPKLCVIGEKGMPNHRALARQFTLFDNGYVSGTNSADGHAWSTQSIANDYMEHFYVGYRTYPDGGDCAMSLSSGGCLWDAAAKKGKSIRVYGEYCPENLSHYEPARPKSWFEAWEDYKKGQKHFTYTTNTLIAGLKPYICPNVHYWPLIQSDQSRADTFLKEYEAYSRKNSVPDLMILCLPCDHTEGMNPDYPTPRAMQADNDLALGRIVEAISHGPHWKDTCIFVIEDDGQALPDHVDGHRVPFMAISPYTKRKAVDSHLYTTASMLRSIEWILGLDPMTQFDALSHPLTTCFNETPDLTPYNHVPNNIPLDQHNPPPSELTAEGRYWMRKSAKLNWSHIDEADPYWLSRINWYSFTQGRIPFPHTPGQPESPREVRTAKLDKD